MNKLKIPLNIQRFSAGISISASECDVDVAKNQSYILLTLSVSTSGQTFNNSGDAYVNATLTGENNTYTVGNTYFTIGYNSSKQAYSGKIGPFKHNTDGKLDSVHITAHVHLTSSTSSDTEAWCKMSTIPRASSFNANNTNIEDICNITINRADSSFNHTITYTFESLSGTIASKVGTSHKWTIPTSFYAQIPKTKSATCTLICKTYDSKGNYIGEKSKKITVSCNSSKCSPSLSASIVDTNTATVNLTGKNTVLVKEYSTAKVTPTATAKNSASISKITIDGTSISGSATYQKVKKNSFVVVATDSRGFSTTYKASTSMIDYIKLTCNPKFKRTIQTGSEVTLSFSGNYFNGSFGKVANTLTLSWAYRLKGASSWTSGGTLSPVLSGNTYTGTTNCGNSFDYQKDYEFIVYFNDKLSGNLSITKGLSRGLGELELYEGAILARGVVLFYDKELYTRNDDGSYSKK